MNEVEEVFHIISLQSTPSFVVASSLVPRAIAFERSFSPLIFAQKLMVLTSQDGFYNQHAACCSKEHANTKKPGNRMSDSRHDSFSVT